MYFELLREIGRSVELRVVVDIVAGASAGGINGTMLARALAHDLPMDALRDLWLDNADVSVLLAPDARAGNWSKWFLKPFIWGAAKTGRFDLIKDLEVRTQALAVRALALVQAAARWARDGGADVRRGHVDGSTEAMPRSSLLPSGHSLDLFVTVTDYYGYQQLVQIHDPPLIHELDHHHILHFAYRRHPGGEVDSDFELDNAPGLAFAARATSSFPGAFPPARIVEMDEVVAQRLGNWPRRSQFIANSFPGHLQAGIDPATASFIDGSVLNNRPFQQAISAIHGRPAYRRGRPPAGLYRSAPAVAGRAAAPSTSRASSRPCAAHCRTSRVRSR